MNILVTGIGGPTPKGIAKSLKISNRNFKIVGIDADPFAAGLYAPGPYDKTYLVPNASEKEFQYWENIKEIVAKEKIDFAFVVPETEVLVWAKRQEQSTLPCRALIPQFDVADFLFDKQLVAAFLQPLHSSPKTINVENSREGIKALENQLGYPYWIRQNKTGGALGSYKVESENDLDNWLRINKHSSNFIASEYLPGRNLACKLLYQQGELILGATGERINYLLANAAPSKISGMCSRGKLINHQEAFKVSDKSIRAIFKKFNLPLTGVFTVDLKEDHAGDPKITEINIRLVSFNHAFTLGGINFPLKIIETFVDADFVAEGYKQFEEELNFIRGVDNDLFVVRDADLLN